MVTIVTATLSLCLSLSLIIQFSIITVHNLVVLIFIASHCNYVLVTGLTGGDYVQKERKVSISVNVNYKSISLCQTGNVLQSP